MKFCTIHPSEPAIEEVWHIGTGTITVIQQCLGCAMQPPDDERMTIEDNKAARKLYLEWTVGELVN